MSDAVGGLGDLVGIGGDDAAAELRDRLSRIRVPAHYRYHVELAPEWRVTVQPGGGVRVIAPRVRPTLPVAIDTARIEKESRGLWSLFTGPDQLAALPQAHEPGAVHNYSTGETSVASEIVVGATGKKLADYLEEKIWQPYGMEADAEWWLDSADGNEIGGSGLSATLRDFARFGQFFLDGGVIDGASISR